MVVVSPNREGLLLLNHTAAFVWKNSADPNLPALYSRSFDISKVQAETEIAQLLAYWNSLKAQRAQLRTASENKKSPARSARRLTPQPSCACSPVTYSCTLQIAQTIFLLHCETPGIADELLPRLSSLEVPAAAPHHTFSISAEPAGFVVICDAQTIAREPLLTGARAQLLLELTRLSTSAKYFGAVLHAGVCGNSHAALILAGSSHSGKSTLCASLMDAGWLCFSDDSAPLDTNFQVVGMPFPLMLREGSWPLFPATAHLPTIERYGANVRFLPSNLSSASVTSAPVQAVVIVDYNPAARAATLIPLESFETLVELGKSGFWIEHSERSTTDFLAWLANTPRYRLTYSSLVSAQEILSSLIH